MRKLTMNDIIIFVLLAFFLIVLFLPYVSFYNVLSDTQSTFRQYSISAFGIIFGFANSEIIQPFVRMYFFVMTLAPILILLIINLVLKSDKVRKTANLCIGLTALLFQFMLSISTSNLLNIFGTRMGAGLIISIMLYLFLNVMFVLDALKIDLVERIKNTNNSKTIVCQKCNKQNVYESNFCYNCGVDLLEQKQNTDKQQPDMSQPVSMTTLTHQEFFEQPVNDKVPQPKIVSEYVPKEQPMQEEKQDNIPKCPSCQSEITDDMVFCGECGEKLNNKFSDNN